MDILWSFDSPIPTADLRAVEAILRCEDLLCTSFADEDVYAIRTYHLQAELYGTSAYIALDRNVFGRIVELANGRSATSEHLIAAAIMTFGQCADLMFEPSLAVHEGAATQMGDSERALSDLALFRAADNLHPSEFADIALGRSQRLRTQVTPARIDRNLLLSQEIRQYSFVYPAVLKMGLIEQAGGPMVERMRRFLEWTQGAWYMTAPATILAAMCFSGSPPKDAFKNLRNSNRELALMGLRNCAWDLAYVTWWGDLLKRQCELNRLYLFCTCDKTLRRVARFLLTDDHSTDEEIDAALSGLFGATVYQCYVDLLAHADDVGRAINQEGGRGLGRTRNIVDELEQQVLAPV